MRSHGTIDRSGEQVPEKAERFRKAMVALGGTRQCHRGCSRVQPLIRQMRLSGGAAYEYGQKLGSVVAVRSRLPYLYGLQQTHRVRVPLVIHSRPWTISSLKIIIFLKHDSATS